MNQMRHDDLKAYRTQQEIDELNRLLEDDATTKEIAKRINVLLRMNIRNNPDGTPVSYKKRLEETTASLDVRDSYVKETLMVYNRAGITGLFRGLGPKATSGTPGSATGSQARVSLNL